jgi:hypothetical protein
MAGFSWSKVPPTTIVLELVQLAAGIVCLWRGWVTLPLLYGLMGFEIVLVSSVSGVIYRRQRGTTAVWEAVGESIPDTAKIFGLWLFCAFFIVGSYAAVGGFGDGLQIAPREFAVLVLLATLRYGWVALSALASTDPRLVWTREATLRGAALAVSALFGAFAAVPGLMIANELQRDVPEVAADVGIGSCLLAMQAFLGCVVASMPPQKLVEITRRMHSG